MKKIICMLVAFTMSLGLFVGCGKPNDISDDAYSAAKDIIKIADQYIDMEIEADEAESKIERLIGRFPYGEKSTVELTLKIMCENLKLSLGISRSDSAIIKERNEIAEKIGQPTR